MKRIDFENGTVTGNILGAALPMLAAQLLNLLYNIVDRVYIARIPHVGTAALGAVGICFPLIMIITAFANLFGGGGAPLFSIYRGKKEEKTAVRIMNTSFSMICASAVLLMIGGFLFAYPVLILFGASKDAMLYAYPYMMIYLIGTLPSMIAVGMNPFINAQGYSVIGMSCCRSSCKSDPGSGIYFYPRTRCKRSSNRNSIVTDDIRNICIFLPFKKSRIESPAFAKGRDHSMYRICQKHCKSWNGRIYYAAYEQSGINLLQSCTFRYRRRYLHFGYDNY